MFKCLIGVLLFLSLYSFIQAAPENISSKSDLDKLISTGMESSLLVQQFGNPSFANSEIMVYEQAGQTSSKNFYVTLKSGKVLEWDISHYLTRAYSDEEINSILKLGMSKEMVREKIGLPALAYSDKLFYIVDPALQNIQNTCADCFSLSFDKNILVRWDIPHILKKYYDKDALDKILYVGMTKDAVLKEFGKPSIEDEFSFCYSFKYDRSRQDKYSGFSIFFRDGKVQKWSFSVTD